MRCARSSKVTRSQAFCGISTLALPRCAVEGEIGAGTFRRLAADVGVWRGWKWPMGDECEAKRNGRCRCKPVRRMRHMQIANNSRVGHSRGHPGTTGRKYCQAGWMLAEGHHTQTKWPWTAPFFLSADQRPTERGTTAVGRKCGRGNVRHATTQTRPRSEN